MAEKRNAPADVDSAKPPAKRQKRPSRLLALSKSPSALKTLAKQNDKLPLFRLPKEIRINIYKLVIGDRLIHVSLGNPYNGTSYAHPSWLCFDVCRCHVTEDDIYRQFINSTENECAKYDFERHLSCEVVQRERIHQAIQQACGLQPPCPKRLSLTLGLLRVSRRIYAEAALLFYNSNTFSFRNFWALEIFLSMIVPVQRREVKSIRLEVRYTYYVWQNFLKNTIASSLTGLRHLSVDVQMPQWHAVEMAIAKPLFQDLKWYDGHLWNLTYLQKCELKSARITMVDHPDPEPHLTAPSPEVVYRWTLQEKREIAAHLEEYLLKPYDRAEYESKESAARKHSITKLKAELDGMSLQESKMWAAWNFRLQLRQLERLEANAATAREKRAAKAAKKNEV